jgi:hypothetical protein
VKDKLPVDLVLGVRGIQVLVLGDQISDFAGSILR